MDKERAIRRMRELAGFQIMGLRCWKCRASVGGLYIPMSQEDTPETLAEYLISKKILPCCESCIEKNPRRISFEAADRER